MIQSDYKLLISHKLRKGPSYGFISLEGFDIISALLIPEGYPDIHFIQKRDYIILESGTKVHKSNYNML